MPATRPATPTAAPTAAPAGAPPVLRVRQQARDAVALMAFSASTSVAVAAGLLLLAQLGR